MEKVLIVADAQAPYHSPVALDIVRQFANDWQPTTLIDLGDRWDFRSLCKYDTEVVKADLRLRFAEDKQAGINWGEQLHECLPRKCKKWFVMGNHEIRCATYLKDSVVMQGIVDIGSYLGSAGYKVIPHGYFGNIGHLYFTHGDTTTGGNHHAKKMALYSGRSVVYGHYHQFQSYYVHSLGTPRGAWGIGMMADAKALEFYNKPPHNWMTGFAYAYIQKNGLFNLYPVIIINDIATIEGVTYKGLVKPKEGRMDD